MKGPSLPLSAKPQPWSGYARSPGPYSPAPSPRAAAGSSNVPDPPLQPLTPGIPRAGAGTSLDPPRALHSRLHWLPWEVPPLPSVRWQLGADSEAQGHGPHSPGPPRASRQSQKLGAGTQRSTEGWTFQFARDGPRLRPEEVTSAPLRRLLVYSASYSFPLPA